MKTTATRPLRSVSRPRQSRSEDTLRRLLDAAEALIEERGHQDLSIVEVARRAESSVGGFYARFRSKDELLRAVEEDFVHRQTQLLDELAAPETWRAATPAEIVRGLIEVLLETHRRHHRLLLAFVARAARDPAHPPEVLAFRQRVGERLGALAAARSDLVSHPDPALAADVAVQAVFGILQARVVSGALGAPDRPLPEATLAHELERLVLAYFGVTAGDTHGR